MQIFAAIMDTDSAPFAERARFVFTPEQTKRFLAGLVTQPSLSGAVLLSTCERTELWVSAEEPRGEELTALLCAEKNLSVAAYGGFFRYTEGTEAIQRLFETACGLRSGLLFEDQILGQVTSALALATDAACADEDLRLLFQAAASCAAKIKTLVYGARNPDLLSAHVYDYAIAWYGSDLSNAHCLVIGNGRVGVSAGRLLQKAGAQVSVTRRKQHHGADPVPREMRTVDYDDRVPYLRTADIVIGATRSPHYTLRAGEASGPLSDGRKRLLIDLAVPADFEPSLFELGRTEGVTLETILSQGSAADPDRESIREAKRILKEEIQKWHLQREKRACLPVIRDAASAVAARVARRCERDLSGETDPDKRLNIVRENSEQAIFSMLADLSEGESDAFAERLQAYLRRKRADGSSLMESVTGS